MAVCNCHDLGSLAPLGLSDQSPPFLAGTNVPSTKHSFRSNPSSSLRCCANTRRSSSITPDLTQFWKRRCAVWYEPYREGMSCQGAPVRSTQRIPLKTARRSAHGRPRPSAGCILPFSTGSRSNPSTTTIQYFLKYKGHFVSFQFMR